MKQTDSYHCWQVGSAMGPMALLGGAALTLVLTSSMLIRWRCVVTFRVPSQENSVEIMNCNDSCMFDVRHAKSYQYWYQFPGVSDVRWLLTFFAKYNSGCCEERRNAKPCLRKIWFASKPADVWFLCLVQECMSYLFCNALFPITARSKHPWGSLQASIACLSFLIAGDLGSQKFASNHYMDIVISWIPHESAQKTRLIFGKEMFQGRGCHFFATCTDLADLKVYSKTYLVPTVQDSNIVFLFVSQNSMEFPPAALEKTQSDFEARQFWLSSCRGTCDTGEVFFQWQFGGLQRNDRRCLHCTRKYRRLWRLSCT